MKLKAIYDKREDVPEGYEDLYAERDGKLELNGVEGIKTQADVDRISSALTKEREDHKKTKASLAAWADFDQEPEKVREQLDRIPELEAQAGQGQDNEKKVEQLVEARLAAKMRPLERENEKLKTEAADRQERVSSLEGRERQRAVKDHILPIILESDPVKSAIPQLLMHAERDFDAKLIEGQDGEYDVLTRDGGGVTPGLNGKDWLPIVQERYPHCWPGSNGTGATNSGDGRGAQRNPYTHEDWSLTRQGVLERDNPKLAKQLRDAAGASDGRRPAPKRPAA